MTQSSPNPRYHPKARRDQIRQFNYLQSAQVGRETLEKFVEALTEAKDKIRDNPQTWSFAPGSSRVRKIQVRDFRLQVFYTVQRNGIPLVLEIAGPGLQPRWPERL